MSEIPYYIIINKPNKQLKLEQKIIHNTGKNLEETKNNIIYVMQKKFNIILIFQMIMKDLFLSVGIKIIQLM